MIQARKALPEDLDYIFKNSQSLGFDIEKMAGCLENMMLVIDNKEICGIGFYIYTASICMINWVYIKEDNRRGKLGTLLVKTILNAAERQGALQAYMPCSSEAFCEFLSFSKVEDAYEASAIAQAYKTAYGTAVEDSIYKASLLDYFKPCSANKSSK